MDHDVRVLAFGWLRNNIYEFPFLANRIMMLKSTEMFEDTLCKFDIQNQYPRRKEVLTL